MNLMSNLLAETLQPFGYLHVLIAQLYQTDAISTFCYYSSGFQRKTQNFPNVLTLTY